MLRVPLRRSLIGALLLSSLAALSPSTSTPAAASGVDRLGIIAHRSGGGEQPESSLAAFQAAVAQRVNTIETDVRFTADHQAVLFHDPALPERCSSPGREIRKMTAAEVAQVRCDDLTGHRVVPIATLEQLAQTLAGHHTRLEMEIKGYPGESAAAKQDATRRALIELKDAGVLDLVTVASFEWSDITPTVRRYAPHAPMIALNSGFIQSRARLAQRMGIDVFSTHIKYGSVFNAEYVLAHGMQPGYWGTETTSEAEFGVYFGNPLISTDFPLRTAADIKAGRLTPHPTRHLTTVNQSPVTLFRAKTLTAGHRYYPTVIGPAVPKSQLRLLDKVHVRLTLTGKGHGTVSVAARGSSMRSSAVVKIPRGTKTVSVWAHPGGEGRLRIIASQKVKATVAVTGYRKVSF